jgi:hypothetical protein
MSILFDSRHFARITEGKFMFEAKKSCPASALAEWWDILSHPFLSNPQKVPDFRRDD